jgi:glycosyltransferase involved in cell wall biosynthesis
MSILVFAKFPPPHTGMTIATSLFADMAEERYCTERIDTSHGIMKPNQLGWDQLKYYLQFSVGFVQRLQRLRERVQDPDVDSLYIVASPSPLGLMRNVLAVVIARPHVSRIVAHVHNGNYQQIFEQPVISKGAHYLARNVDRFIFLSEILSERVSSYIPPPKRYVVRNTIDPEVRCTEEEVGEKIRTRSQRDTLRLLFLSNMIPSKGYMDVARAVSILRSKSNSLDVHADFIGDWPDERDRSEFHTFLVQKELQNAVTVHGRVSRRATIKAVLLDADVFVLPTYYPNEAQPLSIIEAMNAVTPVVSTEHASIPEYVIDGENGYLIGKQSPTEIAEAIQKLVNHSEWGEKARRARDTYEKMHSPSSVKQQFFRALGIQDRENAKGARA